MSSHNYVLIMAGGSGTRLYPRSRDDTPKHLSKIVGTTTLLQQTYKRSIKTVPKENVYISTNERYIDQILKQLPGFKREQIVAEPAKRNTAPAMALGTTIIKNRDPEAVVAAISCDHQVLKENNFAAAFKVGFATISKYPDVILAVGIEPSSPHTGYEYIEKDKLVDKKNKFLVYQVKRFVIRPGDRETAQKYVDLGYYWNASYFIFNAEYFLNEVSKFLPNVYSGLKRIEGVIGTNNFARILRDEFLKFPDAQIDKEVMLKTNKMFVLPADLGWCDVGSWDVVTGLIEEKKKDEEGNYSEGLHVAVDSHNTIVLGNGVKKLIATIGLNNITIVNTEDAILIMERGRGQEVKQVVDELKKRKLDSLL